LAPDLPGDAFATIAFTSSDLWPGDGWNFVFGYASFRDRVGVWSLSRFGNPDEDEEAFKKCLLRTIKVATHETGHMFSIQHCIRFQCNMQGSNSLPESDSQPLALCPECHAKILFATGANPIARYEKLIEFCQIHGLTEQLEFFKKSKAALE
jgi:archaemetzincin